MEIEDYIESHIDGEPEWLEELNRHTNVSLVNGRMCSGHTQGRLLKMLVRMIRPQRVLEMGTFSGYAALSMAEGLPPGAELHTIEADDELEDFIRLHLAKAPKSISDKVHLHVGDAIEVAMKLGGEFDLIFIDADKRQYPQYYQAAMEILTPGGYIIADNTLWDGHVIESGKHAPQTRGIISFNDIVAADERVEKVIIPIRDGLTVIRKKVAGE